MSRVHRYEEKPLDDITLCEGDKQRAVSSEYEEPAATVQPINAFQLPFAERNSLISPSIVPMAKDTLRKEH